MDKFGFKIWNQERNIKKTIVCTASIQELLDKARLIGLSGSRFVLEVDGSEVEDNEALSYFSKETLIILQEGEEWLPVPVPSSSLALSNDMFSNISFENAPSGSTTIDSCSERGIDDHYVPSLPLSSTALSLSNSSEKLGLQCADKLFKDFSIPWEKLPENILNMLREKKKVGHEISTIIHIIISELRQISFYIPTTILRQVSNKLVEKYPASFGERNNDGSDFSFNNSIILTKLINHNNYLNRLKDVHPKIPLKKRKGLKTIEKTCANWQPSLSKEDVEEKNIQIKKHELLSFSNKRWLSKEDYERIVILMNETYAHQRMFLNGSPPIEAIKREWPILLRKECIFQHFDKLMNSHILNFNTTFNEKAEKLLVFAKTIKNSKTATFFSDKTPDMYKEQEAFTFEFIFHYFNEDRKRLFDFLKVEDPKRDIRPPGPEPWIGIVDNDDGFIYYLYADYEEVNCTSMNFLEAVQQLFAVYYNFNVRYPAEASLSLEFIQRFFFNINSDVARGKKRSLMSINKVINLISKVTNSK